MDSSLREMTPHPSQVGELHVGTVFCALDVLGDRLAADHAAFRGVVCQRRRPIERPALVDRRRYTMTEGGIVGTGQVAVGGEALAQVEGGRAHAVLRHFFGNSSPISR